MIYSADSVVEHKECYMMESSSHPYAAYRSMEQKLEHIGQSHLLKFWDQLDEEGRKRLIKDIEGIDLVFFQRQREILKKREEQSAVGYRPFKEYDYLEEGVYAADGYRLLADGKVGAVIVAGGQGTRFGYSGPKGCFEISNVHDKSLFQLFAEKTFYASKMAGRPLPLAIMTSEENHGATYDFFRVHNNFGLADEQLAFFQQSDAPMLTEEGNLFLSTPSTVAKGANGNGDFFGAFVRSGTWKKWYDEGVRYVNFIFIDNPLADPFDLDLVGYHYGNHNQATIKCVERNDPAEKVGVIVDVDGKTQVIEYSEIDDDARYATDSNGGLAYRCANISLFCFDMDLINTVAEQSEAMMPYHLAHKAAQYINDEGVVTKSTKPIAWKYELFIFDMLPHTKKVGALLYPRDRCFAPLKNASGSYSPTTTRESLLERDRQQWRAVARTEPPERVFELSQEFYYPTPEFLRKWENKEMPDAGYIE